MESSESYSVIAKHSIALIVFENGIGSLLHSLQIPLSGHFLSVNQIGILARGLFISQNKELPISVSINASILKSLSPAGKKLTPMLAILVQGILFSLPSFLFGINYFSLLISTILSSLWAFVQPIMMLYVLFGDNSKLITMKLLKGIENYIPNFDKGILILIIVLLLIKIIFSFFYSITLIKMSNEKFEILSEKLKGKSRKRIVNQNPFKSALLELFNPLFIISLVITSVFFIFLEASLATIIWAILRPIAIGLILFYFFKIVPVENFSKFFKKIGLVKISKSIEQTIKTFQEK